MKRGAWKHRSSGPKAAAPNSWHVKGKRREATPEREARTFKVSIADRQKVKRP